MFRRIRPRRRNRSAQSSSRRSRFFGSVDRIVGHKLERRRLHLESLEQRRVLATVTNLLDGPVNAPGDLPGSLRQAIFDTNNSAVDDNIKHAKFWVRDCDLRTVVDMIGNRISFDLFRNNCMPQLMFDSPTAFYRYIFESIKPETRWTIPTYEPDGFNEAYDEMDREGTLPEQIRRLGKMK